MKNAPYESEWNVPDFRDCIADELADIHNEVNYKNCIYIHYEYHKINFLII